MLRSVVAQDFELLLFQPQFSRFGRLIEILELLVSPIEVGWVSFRHGIMAGL